MKIKVIDLLNKIANGEEVPKRIKHYQTYYTWYDNGYSKGYCKEPVMTDGNSFLEITTNYDLLGEVEIIEEEPKKIPEKLEAILDYSKDGNHISKVPNNEQLMFKINEIIDYLKSKGEIKI